MSEQSYAHNRSYPTYNTSGARIAVAIDDASVARTQVFTCGFKAVQIGIHMQTAYTGATASVITINREKEGGTANNDVEVGTFTIPVTAALGDVYFVDVASWGDTELAPGESLSFTSNAGADPTTSVNFTVIGYEFNSVTPAVAGLTQAAVDKPLSGTGDIKYLAGTETTS